MNTKELIDYVLNKFHKSDIGLIDVNYDDVFITTVFQCLDNFIIFPEDELNNLFRYIHEYD